MKDQQSKPWRKVLIVSAAVLFMLSTPCLFGGVLGLLGVLADVGPTENQQMGQQLLRIAAYPLGVGLLLLVVGLFVVRSRPKQRPMQIEAARPESPSTCSSLCSEQKSG